jgi:hypothetical protein
MYLMLAATRRSQRACDDAVGADWGVIHRGRYLYVGVEASKGAAPRHGRNSFRRSCAAGGGLVAGRNGCGVGASFSGGIACRPDLFLVALHEAHGQNLSRSTTASQCYRGACQCACCAGGTLVDRVDAAASLAAGALGSSAACARSMQRSLQKHLEKEAAIAPL